MTHKYIMPLVEIAGCIPLLTPTCCGSDDIEQYLDMVYGVYLTGAGSNIDPSLYGQDNLTPEKPQDRDRDLFDLPLIHAALRLWPAAVRHLPWHAGAQCGARRRYPPEALQRAGLQRSSGKPGRPGGRAIRCQPRHPLRAGQRLAELLGEEEIAVNSLHGQGIRTLGRGVAPLAHAPDGVIEAIHLPEQGRITLGVQWPDLPEWQAASNPQSVAIFQAFGQACRQFSAQR